MLLLIPVQTAISRKLQACPAPALNDSACIERIEVVLRRAAARGEEALHEATGPGLCAQRIFSIVRVVEVVQRGPRGARRALLLAAPPERVHVRLPRET